MSGAFSEKERRREPFSRQKVLQNQQVQAPGKRFLTPFPGVMTKLSLLVFMLVAMSLVACTAEQTYYSGQAWQRNPCSKAPDQTAYDRCMENAGGTYDSYKRETDPDRK